jgi:hypothetical protein
MAALGAKSRPEMLCRAFCERRGGGVSASAPRSSTCRAAVMGRLLANRRSLANNNRSWSTIVANQENVDTDNKTIIIDSHRKVCLATPSENLRNVSEMAGDPLTCGPRCSAEEFVVRGCADG